MRWSRYLECIFLGVVGCSTSEVASVRDNGELGIGSACTESDGWQAEAPPCSIGTAPTVCPPSPDSSQLPPGVRYCMINNPLFPGGYFTSNCSASSECPLGTFCDGSLCRMPCASDGDCRNPNKCEAIDSAYPAFCQALHDAPRM